MEIDDHLDDSLIPQNLQQEQDVLMSDLEVPAGVLVAIESLNPGTSSTSGSFNLVDHSGSTSDLSYQDVANDDVDDYTDDDEAVSDYDDNSEYVSDDDDNDDYLKLQAQFEHVNLPHGVEASVPWLPDPPTSASVKGEKNSGAGSSKAESSSKVRTEIREEAMDDVFRKLMFFKQFDTVAECSDHQFLEMKFSGRQPAKFWAKKIQEEWKILEDNLPDTIYVRVYESRMDLLRAVIIGPAGTPYDDGLFVFDAVFPPSYPNEPPVVHYHSSGFRLNPNLYECGKVCLSLLNTWHGGKQEMWLPEKSTMLQVLVSIQALILNAEPFFNEPGFEKNCKGPVAKKRSRQYNEDIFIKSLKKMMYTLKTPPQHFEDLVTSHFRVHAYEILTTCRAYADGAEVGCNIKKWLDEGPNAQRPGSENFKSEVAVMMKTLLKYFIINGSRDCEKFQS